MPRASPRLRSGSTDLVYSLWVSFETLSIPWIADERDDREHGEQRAGEAEELDGEGGARQATACGGGGGHVSWFDARRIAHQSRWQTPDTLARQRTGGASTARAPRSGVPRSACARVMSSAQ